MWRNDIENLNENKLSRDFIRGDGETISEAEEADEFRDQNSGAGAGEAEPIEENLGLFWKCETARREVMRRCVGEERREDLG